MVLNTGQKLDEDYEADYFSHEDLAAGHRNFLSEWSREYDRRRFTYELETMIGPPARQGRLLDIGSATGSYLRLAREMGWSVIGVEVSAEAREIAADAGLESVSSLKELPAAERFPLITMHHVLEHVEEPAEMLAECRRRLATAGRVLIEVPNFRSLERKGMADGWIDLRPEQHRWQFEPSTLRQLLEQCGFHVLTIRTLGEPIPTLRTVARTLGIPISEAAAVSSPGGASGSDVALASRKQETVGRVATLVDSFVNRARLGKRLLALASSD